MLLLTIAGCGLIAPFDPGQPAGPADPDAVMAPELLIAPEQASAGEIIGLRFPELTARGIHFVLEVEDGDSWQHAYDLVSTANGGLPAWSRAGDDEFAVPDVGAGGPGPDRVQIPDEAAPGSYRICTGNAGENFCAPIRIVDS